MKNFILSLVLVVLSFNSYGFSQNENDSSNKPYFQLQSIHLDFTSLIFINDISISSDFEIYKTYLQSFGIQTGYSYFQAGSVGGSEYGSPFQDINILAYSSIGYDKLITTQLIIGYTYRISSISYFEEYPVGGIKYGVSFNLNLDKSIKIYIKYSAFSSYANFGMSAIGLGLSVGWAK